ncbi:GNAT family N-acetyltransferase [Brevundimonas sp. NPDC090276]|uniref:GNAT family N-acetyltransferase n=1 Tax=Brevundimonas sp. NPDC090276 TaxID=3363956 RepID=UPI00383A0F48
MSKPEDRIVAYTSAQRAAWKALNTGWLAEGGFALEAKDHLTLDDPEGQILSNGGHIFFAERDGTPVGCCGLIAMSDGGFEVTKMTVRPEARGGGLALRLLEACEAAARVAGAHRLYLETSSTLGAALGLYARFGFVDLPPQPTPYARADVWMEKRL